MKIKSKKDTVKSQNRSEYIEKKSEVKKTEISIKESIQIENICDENLSTLNKIHAILLNCSNLSKKQKSEFCESERYFMKLYLSKLKKQIEGK
ncbi:MAG: hypothetical protein ACFFG0_57420 [Candidatus Thorarchaeota archaeon]